MGDLERCRKLLEDAANAVNPRDAAAEAAHRIRSDLNDADREALVRELAIEAERLNPSNPRIRRPVVALDRLQAHTARIAVLEAALDVLA